MEQRLAPLALLEEPDVAGQARRMGEQHAQRHLVPRAARGFALGKGGKNLRQGLV